jgi:hypothetical protein
MAQRFPLLTLSLALFVALNLTTGDAVRPWYQAAAFSIHLISTDTWNVSAGDLFLVFSIFLLFVAVLRATRSGRAAVTNHALAVIVFVGALILFISQPGYGNSIFFLFTLMTLFDFLAGFIISVVAARRDISFESGAR